MILLRTPEGDYLNPSNAEATFVRSTRMQIFLKSILTLSCWFSLDSSQMGTLR